MNILFYGNCQLFAVLKTLNLSNNYNIFHIECWNNNINKQYFTDIIINCDVIITQPINDNYNDVEYLSTNHIKKHKNPNCKLIIFDSCHFNFYYFDLTYKMFNNDVLHDPIDYHYNTMIECYNNNNSVHYYVDNFVNNLDLKSSEELEIIAEHNLKELHDRYTNNKVKYNGKNIYIISTYEYIKENYKDKLLFWSINHPTKFIIQFICKTIVDILQIENTINMDIDVFSNVKCILYKCISKNVKFDINNHTPLLLNITDVVKITQLYYDTYEKIDFK